MKKILWVARDSGGCGFFRCQQPARFIREMGLAQTEVVLNNPTHEQLMSADLVIMQEMGFPSSSDIARFLIEHHIPFVTEVDDFLHHVSPHNLGGYGAWNPSTLHTHRAMEMIRSSFALQVSTNQLAREYFPYNPTVFVIPNCLDKDVWDNPTPKRNDDKIRIGWAGGNAHGDDLMMISRVLSDIVKEFKGRVIFETIGMTDKELHGVFNFKTVRDNCPSCGFEGEAHHIPGLSLEEYPMAICSRGWDIAVAPVINNAFGNCKSDLKIKEYSAAGIPVVASPVVPYVEAAKDGANIAFADTYDEWYNAIKDLIKSPKKREKMAVDNREWVKRYWIQDNAQRIFGLYGQIITKAESVLGKKEDRS